jgi:type 2 lantibiotic biosynthesis protein LanM
LTEATKGGDSINAESFDWYHATTLSERIGSIRRCHPAAIGFNHEIARDRLELWQSEFPNTLDGYLSWCQATYDLGENDLLHILGEPIEDVKNRADGPPQWLRSLISAFSTASSSHPVSFQEQSGGTQTVLFLNLIEPLIRQAFHRLRDGVACIHGENPLFIVDDRVEYVLLANVERQLLPLLVPTMVLELNVARVQGLLEGETPELRFESFIARLQRPDIALAMLREYPTIARQAVICLDHWVTFSIEFLRHLSEDWLQLANEFRGGQDLGRVVALDDSKGDQHRDGRSVQIITFDSGFRIVYKPRPLAVAKHFQELQIWLNERGAEPPLGTIEILDRGTYGWIEFISPRGCVSGDEARRFYERHGEYLALLYAIEATDFHYENLIAAGEHPILIDLETLFQPCFRDRDYTADKVHRDSILRLGLLPQRMFGNGQDDGIDISGLGAAAGQPLPFPVLVFEARGTDEMRLIQKEGASAGRENQPTLDGTKLEPLDYVEPITKGFATMYKLLQRHVDELLSANGPLARFEQDIIRVVLRPTVIYGLLLRSSLHPDTLRDALDRDAMFGTLYWDSPHLDRTLAAEIADLHNRDIPVFTTSPGSMDVLTSSGEIIADFFPETGMSLVHQRLRRLGKSDYLRQLWFIRASLATTASGQKPVRWPARPPRHEPHGANNDQLLGAAKAAGERLETLALRSAEDVSWIGLALTKKDTWSLVPLGLDLYNGLPGVAFFLAYLGKVSQEIRYTTLARRAAETIRRQLSALPLHHFPVGAFEGLGGIIYLFTHLGILWDEQELLLEATRLAESSRALISYDRKFDITGGSAGCIMCLLALQSVTPCEKTLAAALECGDHLLSHAQAVGDSMAWEPHFPAKAPLAGLAHGASGIAFALLELSASTGEKRFSEAAWKAVQYENSLFSIERKNWLDLREPINGSDQAFMAGWCHGAPGIALARLRALQHIDSVAIRNDIAAGLETTLGEGFRGDHSLCHGSVGNLEPLLQASEVLDRATWTQHINRVSAEILQSIDDHGWLCGVPLGVESPGLMTGLAGIGYGLLRVADPSNIPALLLLAPPIWHVSISGVTTCGHQLSQPARHPRA